MVFGNGAFGLALQTLRTPLRFIGGQQSFVSHVPLCLCYFIVLCSLYPLLYLLLTALSALPTHNILPRVRHYRVIDTQFETSGTYCPRPFASWTLHSQSLADMPNEIAFFV
jgi:hypothetical protein